MEKNTAGAISKIKQNYTTVPYREYYFYDD